ncbi:DUF3108 domain-containing protein [Ningiella sp. W23]|uniref:DUF3108 domain-containing protein n=1 Tax=Ningiella sp. W23 TaxID=3023715 RepID=UPI003756BFAA
MNTSYQPANIALARSVQERCIASFLSISAFLLIASFPALSDIRPFESHFVAYYDGKDVGEARLSLRQLEDERYELSYQSKVSKFFLSDRRYEQSVFSVEDDALVPHSYEYKREGTGPNKNLSVSFDKQNKRILVDNEMRYDWNDELDNQLFRYDLSQQLKTEKSNFDYYFINYRGERRHYNLQVQEIENVSLPFGEMEAVKVKINRETNKRVTYAWFAPDLDYSLVRLQQFKSGKEQGDIKLKTFSTD